jgi:hypothetical protein
MNLKKVFGLIPPSATDMIDSQLQEAERDLVQYTLQAEYMARIRDYQRARIQKLQELKNEILYCPDADTTNTLASERTRDEQRVGLFS